MRFTQTLLAVVILATASVWAGINPLAAWWFWVGATAALTAAVVQPYFTGASAALTYGLAAVGAFVSAERTGVEQLWVLYIVIAGMTIAGSVFALTLEPDRKDQQAAHWISTRLGRPAILGFAALLIETLRLASSESLEVGTKLAVGGLLALLLAVLDWYRLWSMTPFTSASLANIETAIEPNLILVSTEQRLERGSRVQVTGRGSSSGVVISNLAHKSGNRIQIALDAPWVQVAPSGGSQCVVEIIEDESDPPVAFAVEGSSERSISLRPFGSLSYGDTVLWKRDDRSYLYQVTTLRLDRLVWDGSTVIEERAHAVQLGSVTDSASLEFDPALPDPYQPVRSARKTVVPLRGGFHRIGRISGTEVEFGVSPSSLRGHHVAILGMSGMGKSTVSRRLTELMKSDSFVVVMDGTGEYRSKFSYEPLDQAREEDVPGCWVYEPAGEPAHKATDFIKSVMEAANKEYKAGVPLQRTLLMEEAHSYLPEWNFTSKQKEKDWVAESCRYILQARKFGLNFIMVSQRTAVISKSAISQCESYIIFRTLDVTSLDYIEGIAGKDMREAVSSLSRYQAVCVGPAFSTTSPVIVDLDGTPAS